MYLLILFLVKIIYSIIIILLTIIIIMNIEYSKIYNININNKNDYVKDNIENIIIDFNMIKYIFNTVKNIDVKYYKYLNYLYFLITNTKKADTYNYDIYEKKNEIIINNDTYNILKNKFIIWPRNYPIFIVYSLQYNILNKCKNFLLITSNFNYVEAIKFYNNKSNITTLEYDSKYKKNNNIWLEDINLIKEKYKFKNYNFYSDIDKIINDDKIYDAFAFDLVFISQYNEELQDKEKFINVEKENLFLLDKVYQLFKKLKIGGIMLLSITTMVCKETLLLLQSFSLCFEKCQIFSSRYLFNHIKFPILIFINYKKQVKPLTYITTDFYNSIKEFYESQLDLFDNLIQKYNLILKNKDNQEFLLSMEYQNLAYSYEIAKFLKFDTYNVLDTDDKDDKEKKNNIDANIYKIFIVSLKNLVLIDTNNTYLITNIEDKKNIFNKISKNKVSKNEFQIFFKNINNNLEDLYKRPVNTVELVINFLYLNNNIIKKNLLLYDINIIDNLVSIKWIQ